MSRLNSPLEPRRSHGATRRTITMGGISYGPSTPHSSLHPQSGPHLLSVNFFAPHMLMSQASLCLVSLLWVASHLSCGKASILSRYLGWWVRKRAVCQGVRFLVARTFLCISRTAWQVPLAEEGGYIHRDMAVATNAKAMDGPGLRTRSRIAGQNIVVRYHPPSPVSRGHKTTKLIRSLVFAGPAGNPFVEGCHYGCVVARCWLDSSVHSAQLGWNLPCGG